MTKEAKPMKTLAFGEGLLEPTLSGKKKITIRKFRPEAHTFAEGEIFLGKFADGMDVTLQSTAATEVKTASAITEDEAIADGFTSSQDAFDGLQKYYPDLTPETELGIIRFRIPQNDE